MQIRLILEVKFNDDPLGHRRHHIQELFQCDDKFGLKWLKSITMCLWKSLYLVRGFFFIEIFVKFPKVFQQSFV